MATTRTLVTGGTGFIGAYVAGELARSGRVVVVFDLHPFPDELAFAVRDVRDRIEVRTGSIEDWTSVVGVVKDVAPDEIVHLAAITNPVALFRNPAPGVRVNLSGTLNVLDAVRLFGVKRLVYFSSIGVLPAIQYEPIDAAHPIFLPQAAVGTGIYGATKIAGEAFCFAYHNAFGIDFRVIRPSAVYGFGMQYPIYVKPMVEGAVRGEAVSFESGGPFPRDYTHVADLASLARACLEAPAGADRIFYGATGQPLVTASTVAALVRELVPGADIRIGAGLTPEDEIELAYRGRISIDNAREHLGWVPLYRDIREGLREYIETYRLHLEVDRCL